MLRLVQVGKVCSCRLGKGVRAGWGLRFCRFAVPVARVPILRLEQIGVRTVPVPNLRFLRVGGLARLRQDEQPSRRDRDGSPLASAGQLVQVAVRLEVAEPLLDGPLLEPGVAPDVWHAHEELPAMLPLPPALVHPRLGLARRPP